MPATDKETLTAEEKAAKKARKAAKKAKAEAAEVSTDTTPKKKDKVCVCVRHLCFS
jgi:hypothetical protein